jgi:hypothetical protein
MRRRCASPKTTQWSTHSRRIDPISRSAKPFCQGEAGAIGLSRMPMAQIRRNRLCLRALVIRRSLPRQIVPIALFGEPNARQYRRNGIGLIRRKLALEEQVEYFVAVLADFSMHKARRSAPESYRRSSTDRGSSGRRASSPSVGHPSMSISPCIRNTGCADPFP